MIKCRFIRTRMYARTRDDTSQLLRAMLLRNQLAVIVGNIHPIAHDKARLSERHIYCTMPDKGDNRDVSNIPHLVPCPSDNLHSLSWHCISGISCLPHHHIWRQAALLFPCHRHISYKGHLIGCDSYLPVVWESFTAQSPRQAAP